MQNKKTGFELITLGHLLKRERDRKNEKVKDRVLGKGNNVLCSDLNILKFLIDNQDKEIYQKDVEQFLALTAPSVSNKLRDLEKKGLITRSYSKVDTRLKQVSLTEKAMDINNLINKEIQAFENDIDLLLEEEEKKVISRVIAKLKKEYE